MRILLAEHEVPEREKIRDVLLGAGYEVKLASEGEETVEFTGQGGCAVVILALDWLGGEGVHVLREVREKGCAGPILLLTSKEACERSAEGLDAGADDFLVKPVSGTELLARLRARLRPRPSARKTVLCVEDL
jgi:DNA-binding response OmpR family regulator